MSTKGGEGANGKIKIDVGYKSRGSIKLYPYNSYHARKEILIFASIGARTITVL
jgi:hypothetical protein